MLQARLKVVGGKHEGQVIPLTQRKFLIGREADCQLRTSSGLVSRHHCVFAIDDYALRLRDLGSTNGTFVNGERIRGEVILKAGDHVQVGKLEFEVELPIGATAGAKEGSAGRTDFLFPAAEAEAAPDVLASDTAYELPVESGYKEADTAIVSAADTAVIPTYNPGQPQQPPAPYQQPAAAGYYPQQPAYYDPYQQPPAGYYPPPGQYPYPQPGYYPQYGVSYPPQQMPGYYPPPGQYPYPQQQSAPPAAAPAAEGAAPALRLPDPESTGAKDAPSPGATGSGSAPGGPATATPSQRAADIIRDRMKKRPQA